MENLYKKIEKKPQRFYETWTFLVVFCIILPIFFRTFFYSPFHIPSGSMKPNLLVGDYIMVSKFSYGYSRYSLPFGVNLIEGRVLKESPQRGDIIVFKLPTDTSVDYIKRLVGLPGDRIQVKAGVLYVNGEALKTECESEFQDELEDGKTETIKQCIETLPNNVIHYILDQFAEGPLDNTAEFTVPEGNYFFMGDNRDNSQDSRVMEKVGFVPEINLVGRAEVIVFSTKDSIWKIWKWHEIFRGDRFFKTLIQKPLDVN